ncbi:protein FAM32A [Diorhabda carinulata]|uniref:protein FAM32A n=1 Tax=Diorhabda sublineata TaxID=1163346 RepID=UPI0024E054FC|nr:protein FAM32A [Diorhabda sublineata]XP_057666532.1 protein FAM32A [Diorhabda carinulata]
MGETENDPYAIPTKSKLKLKCDTSIKKKKKKKDKLLEKVSKTIEAETNTQQTIDEQKPKLTKTKAEIAFLQQQEKMKMKRILEKASQTHKERVEKFNQHLDSLTEHFDIPKVSWTK